MHELGVIIEVVKSIERIAERENLTEISALVLQIGELSSVIPGYIRECYPAAVDGTLLEETELVIETAPGNVRCGGCGAVYRFLEQPHGCPHCGGRDKEILCGQEFIIKEIVAR